MSKFTVTLRRVTRSRSIHAGIMTIAGGALVLIGFLTMTASRPPLIHASPLRVSAPIEGAFNILVVANGRDFPNGPRSSNDVGPFPDQVDKQLDKLLDSNSKGKNEILSRNRERLNFWLAEETVTLKPSAAVCLSHDYHYQSMLMAGRGPAFHPDVVVIFHTQGYQDCASGRIATARLGKNSRLVHELSHVLFGLPDEYCCDGAYFELEPILMDSLDDCKSMARDLGIQDGCQQVQKGGSSAKTVDYWRLEPPPDVMMKPDSLHEHNPVKQSEYGDAKQWPAH